MDALPPPPIDDRALAALTSAQLRLLLDGVVEHSPWVAEALVAGAPFAGREALRSALAETLRGAGPARQVGVLNAHPELGAKTPLTAVSRSEQTGAGLTALAAAEADWLRAHNAAYRARFGFPFVICARATDRAGIKAALAERLTADPEAERARAIEEVIAIAQFRLDDRLGR